MRIDHFSLKNFRGFESFETTLDPNFTVFVGENGAGKTSAIRGLEILLGKAFHHLFGEPWPTPREGEIRVSTLIIGERVVFEESRRCALDARGYLQGAEEFAWGILYKEGAFRGSDFMAPLPEDAVWPLIVSSTSANYELANRAGSDKPNWNKIMGYQPSRKDGYDGWNEPKDSIAGLIAWLGSQEAIFFQNKEEPEHYRVVKSAILKALPGATKLWFDAKYGEPCIKWEGGECSTFSILSDGQKSIMALVGDLARRCCLLNPQLGEDVLEQTPGVVLIDEIDTHLHPRWQREIVGDLKRTFPRVQFVATTHSPFVIQSLDPGELRVLGSGTPDFEYWNEGIEDIVEQAMAVEQPQRSERYRNMLSAAEEYFRMLHQEDTPSAKLEAAREKVLQQSAELPNDGGMASLLKLKEMRRQAETR